MSRHAALKLARSLELDLVEVQRNVTPPVCKIKDYLKEKYVLDTKEKERAKEKSAVTIRQGACKEIRFSGKITQKDLEVKADAAKRLMESGYRVKCVALGNVSSENGESSTKLISRFSALIEDSAVVESHTRVEDKDQTHVIMRHVKYGSLKKGSVKKANRCGKEMADTDVEEEENPGRAATSANNDCDQLFDIPENLGNVSQKPNDETLLRAQGSSRYSSASGHSNYASHGGRETPRPSPEFSNVARQPRPNMNASPQSRGTEQGFGEFSISRSPPNTSRFPSAPNFGIFSTPENAAEKRGGPAEVNRYKQRTGSDSQRNSSPPRPMGHGNRGISGTGDGSPQIRQSHR